MTDHTDAVPVRFEWTEPSPPNDTARLDYLIAAGVYVSEGLSGSGWCVVEDLGNEGCRFLNGDVDFPTARDAIDAAMIAAAPSAPAVTVPLEWTDPAPPCETCRYDHVTAQSPLGELSIEWKSWKKYDAYCLYLNGEYVGSFLGLDDAKAAAQQQLAEMAAKLQPYALQTERGLIGENPASKPMAQGSVSNATLAAPVQMPEPAARTTSHEGEFYWDNHLVSHGSRFGASLYTEQQVRQLLAAQERKPLTDEQISGADRFVLGTVNGRFARAKALIRLVERTHGITGGTPE